MSFSIHQDVFQKEVYFGDVYMIMDGGDKEIYTNNGLNTKDRLRVMRFGGNMLIRAPKTGISIKPEFAQGLDFLGARKSNEYSSRGADCVFSKFGLSFREKIYLPYDMTLELKSSMQVAGSKLTPQEQMSLGGMYSVRGYPYGDYYADNAVQSTVELLVPPAFLPDSFKLPGSKDPLKKNIQGLLFFDHGYGVKRGANEGEKNEQKLASCGTGMRIRVYDQLYVRLEWGFILPMGDKSLTESADSHFHVLIDFEDKFLDHLAGKITVPSPPAH
jgi:hemolysin activation/secretion protein